MSLKPSLAIALSVLLFMLPACGRQGEALNGDNSTTRMQAKSVIDPPPTRRKDIRDLQAEADSMADVAVKVPNVSRATAVINGATVYVGITMADTVRSSGKAANIREEVRQRVQAKMPPSYRIRVSSDATIFGRIQDIGAGLRDGTPVNNYRIQMNDLHDHMPERMNP